MPLEANNATFQQTMQIMQQMQSSTNTSGGVQVVEQEFNAHARPGAFKAMVILTDGRVVPPVGQAIQAWRAQACGTLGALL